MTEDVCHPDVNTSLSCLKHTRSAAIGPQQNCVFLLVKSTKTEMIEVGIKRPHRMLSCPFLSAQSVFECWSLVSLEVCCAPEYGEASDSA
jgi:hypothetical protein